MKGFFDPARDGFGFANPLGTKFPGDGIFGRLVSPFLGRGLCFGMVVAALSGFAKCDVSRLDERLSDYLSQLHLRQFRLPVLVFVIKYWLTSRGGRAEYALDRLRTATEKDPHIICFGPGMSRNFVSCFGKSHAIAPYRIDHENDEVCVFVYDPNHPKRRDLFIRFDPLRVTFRYGEFSSEGGFGITLVPLSVVMGSASAGL